jgi:hypothetical protein
MVLLVNNKNLNVFGLSVRNSLIGTLIIQKGPYTHSTTGQGAAEVRSTQVVGVTTRQAGEVRAGQTAKAWAERAAGARARKEDEGNTCKHETHQNVSKAMPSSSFGC